jgi:peptide/nickel transport system substrate-binding protein
MKNRRMWVCVLSMILVLALVVGLAGCGKKPEQPVAPTPQAEPEYTLVVGLAASILTLDPANHRNRYTETVVRNLYDGLVTRKPNGTVVPEIAESWTNPEPTIWEFKIRQGVKFHDGSDLTVEDVKFTFDRVIKEGAMEGETSPRKGLLGPLTDVEIVNSNTVRFILSEPWPILLNMLPHQQIVSKAYLEKVGKDIASKPMGTGPFKFVEGSIDERIILERFDDYYGGSPDIPPVGKAPAKRVIFEFIPEVATRMAALQSGNVDIIHEVPPSMVPQLQSDPNTTVKTVDGTRMHMFEMNVNMAPFDNKLVRQAMNYAIDIDTIVREVLMGYGATAAGPLLPHGFAVNPNIKPYGHDPEKAKALLTEAGYPNGFAVVIDTTDALKDVVQAAAGQLRAVGIDATVRTWDWGVLTPLLTQGDRAMVFGTWGNSTMDPSDLLEPKLKTKDRGNYSLYANPELDRLLNAAVIETDVAKRKDLYFQAQKIIHEDAPWVFGYVGQEIEACRSNIENWLPSTDSRINMHRVKRVQ